MALHANKIFFQIYPPWKHRVLTALQIRIVVFLLLLITLSPPPWTHGRSTGGITTTPEPNSTSTPEQTASGISQFILDMYEALNRNNKTPVSPGNTFYSRFVGPEQMKLVHLADTVRSFYPQRHTTVQERTQLQQRLTLDFNIRSIHARERIHFAELRIWKSSVNNSQFNSLLSNKDIPGQCLTLFLYATRRDGTGKDYTFVVGRLRLKPKDLIQPEYLSIHSSRLINRISRWPLSLTLKLTLRLSTQCNNQANLTDLGITDTISADPLLLIYTVMEDNDGYNDIPQDIVRQVVRRSADTSEASDTDSSETEAPWLNGNIPSASTSCQRYSNEINFEQLGWGDWVVFPRSFDAHYCYGHCHHPIPSFYNSTNHALLQALIHINNPERAPPVCCSPTDYEELPLLYREKNSFDLTLKKYKNMIALSCGCR